MTAYLPPPPGASPVTTRLPPTKRGAGTVVQAVAECLAGLVYINSVVPGAIAIWSGEVQTVLLKSIQSESSLR